MKKITYPLTIVVLMGLLIVLQLWPLGKQRGRMIDGVISGDISTINFKADDYARVHGRAPTSVSDLDVDAALKKRAKAYDYTLEKSGSNDLRVCAVFKTDTRNDNSQSVGTNPLTTFTSSSYYSYGSDHTNDPYYHGKGKECFTYTLYSLGYGGGNYYNSYQSGPVIDDTKTF
jgi:competence protein ComGC